MNCIMWLLILCSHGNANGKNWILRKHIDRIRKRLKLADKSITTQQFTVRSVYMNTAEKKDFVACVNAYVRLGLIAAIAIVAALFLSCNDPVSSTDNGGSSIDKKSNWFKVDGTTYSITSAYVKTEIQDSSFKSSAASSGITLVTSTGIPLMTIVVIGNSIPVGTWSLPSENAYLSVMGHNSKLYFFIPISRENYLLSDKCKDAATMIGGTLTISKKDSIYEITVDGAKLTTTIHQTTDANDPHPAGTATVSAYYKGKVTVSNGGTDIGECGKNVVLPSNFLIKYNFLFLNSTLAKIGNDFYDALDGFYKKKIATWELYEKNDDSVWVRKDTSVCPYKECIMLWDPSNESTYKSLPSEEIIGINCRKYAFNFSDTSGVTYWVHPDYDIILKYSSNYLISMTYEATSFSTAIASWSELGLVAP
jgi:hypothetical protein